MSLKLLLFVLVVATVVKAQTYTAAVLEYAPQERQTVDTDEEYVLRNVRRYMDFILPAATRGVNIIVFPEYGLTTTILPTDLTNVSTIVPAASLTLAPCDNRMNYSNFFVDLSCAAREHSLFLVVNLIEREAGNETNVTLFYNTNVVFDISGRVVARYRKINLFNEPQLTPGNETVTFTAFNATFGVFSSFDILFRKPGQEVLGQGATDIIFPTAWTSETPFLHSFSIQDGYAKSAGVNLLASGYSNITNGMAGAAIFTANATVATSSLTPAAIQTMNVAVLNRLTNRTVNTVCNNTFESAPRIGLLPEISAVLLVLRENMDNYTFQNLPENVSTTSGTICSGDSKFCCNYQIEFNTQLNNASTIYRMVAFYGVRGFQATVTPAVRIGLATCALIHCSGENTNTCGLFNSTSNVNFRRIRISASLNNDQNTFYQPATLDTNHAPITNYAYCTNQEGNVLDITMSIENAQNVFTFGIFGRLYLRDGSPVGRGAATTINVSFVGIFTALICLMEFWNMIGF